MQSAQNQDRLAAVERRLAEMRTRTLSTLAVTNPVDGQTYLTIHDNIVIMFDSNGSEILANAISPRWGYEHPWQVHVLFPASQEPPSTADVETMSDSVVAVFRPNHARITVTTSTRVLGDPGGVAEVQALYSVNGGANTLIADSVFSTASHTDVQHSWQFVWPTDHWNDVLKIRFQARIQPGAGGFHRVAHGPIRLYGAPQ